MHRISSRETLVIALLVSVSATAQAQTVTLYGVVDVGAVKLSRGAYQLSANKTSRLGLRGQEDIGGGVKAIFQLESELAADTGAVDNNAFWGRQAWVGVQGDLGTLRVGRTKNVVDGVCDDIDPFTTDGIVGDNTKTAWRAGVVGSRVGNAITYATPKMNGFRIQSHLVFDELSAAGKKGWAVVAGYESDHYGAFAGWEKPAVTTANQVQDRAWVMGAWAQLGGLRLSAGLSHGERPRNSREQDGLLIGAAYALDAQSQVKAVYSRLKRETTSKGVVTKTDDNKAYGLGYDYAFSKRTAGYVLLMREQVAKVSGTQIGVTHRF